MKKRLQLLWWEGPSVHLEELRSSVGRRSTEGVQLTAQCELIAEAKVGYFDVHVSVQQQVLCLRQPEVRLTTAQTPAPYRRCHPSTSHKYPIASSLV